MQENPRMEILLSNIPSGKLTAKSGQDTEHQRCQPSYSTSQVDSARTKWQGLERKTRDCRKTSCTKVLQRLLQLIKASHQTKATKVTNQLKRKKAMTSLITTQTQQRKGKTVESTA